MLWKIDGVDRETGEDRRIWLEASSKDDASNLASNHNMMISGVAEGVIEPAPVSQALHGPIEVVLNRKQMKSLRVGVTDIAAGVLLGLFLWSIFSVVLALVFWGVVIAGLANAVSGA